MRFLLTNFFLCIVSYASSIEVYGTKSTFYNLQTQKRSYSIVAKEYIIKTEAIQKEYNYFNRKEVARTYHYRKDGVLKTDNKELFFDKAYFVDNSLVCENSRLVVDEEELKAKECSYKDNKLTCNKIRFFKDGKIVRTKLTHTF